MPVEEVAIPHEYSETGVGTQVLDLMAGATRYTDWLIERVSPAIGRRVMEIGAGSGTITSNLLDRELVVAVDVSPHLCEQLRAQFARHPNVRVVEQDLQGSTGGLEGLGIDSAVSINVFEHIEDDLAAMRSVFRILPPGGTFGLLVPAHPLLHGRFDRDIGHHRRYTKRDLRSKLEAAGFEIDRLRRSNPVGAIGWLVNFRLLGKGELSGVQLYDRAVRALAGFDRLVEPPFGLSLVALARKPAI